MIDLRIIGGTVLDGTGAPPRQADVAIDGGRVVAITEPGGIEDTANRTFDAAGRHVAPGFVDVHTHYDAQVFWDPALTPSCFHGVTTVFAGNCGFTIAPYRAADGDYLLRLLARVEGIPVAALEAGVPWGSWSSTAEYLAAVEGRMALNMGFLVGHSAMRRAVLGQDASTREATGAEVAAMAKLLAEGIEAGGLGFSTSGAPTHNDDRGNPVPSRAAGRDEFLALCRVVERYAGTTVEMVPGQGLFERNVDLMAAMSAAANRPLNWNVLQVNTEDIDLVEARLAASATAAAAAGGRLVPLTLPDALRTRLSFESGFLLDTLPGWREPMALPPAEKLAFLGMSSPHGPPRRPGRSCCGASTTGPACASGRPARIATGAGSSVRSPRPKAATPSTRCARSSWPTACAPASTRPIGATTTTAGSCGPRCGAAGRSSSAPPTPAPTST
jgi:hypothetical protein